MSQPLTRRQWLGGTAAAGVAFSIVPRHMLGGAKHTAPNDKLALAGIGLGGIGFPQLQDCERAGFEIVALCDAANQLLHDEYREGWSLEG